MLKLRVVGRFQSLQVLRFLAALGVTYEHCAAAARVPTNGLGAFGVDVFFVISGFIITRTARASPQRFLANRVLRVVPLYYLASAPFLLLIAAEGPLDWRRLVASLLFWPALDGFSMPYLAVGWTLCFEMLFYASVWFVLRGARAAWLIGAYGALAAASLFSSQPVLHFLGAPLIIEFLFGVGLAYYGRQSPGLGAVTLLACICALVSYGFVGTHDLGAGWGGSAKDTWLRPVVYGLPAALIVFGALQLEPMLRGAWLKPLVFLGDASYSLYLSHLLVLALIGQIWPVAPAWLCICLCIAVGASAYVLVERPLLGVLHAALTPRASAAEAAGA
jgi:exopolysaccharide production protein ExoZ